MSDLELVLKEIWHRIKEFFQREDVRNFLADNINEVVNTMIRVAAMA